RVALGLVVRVRVDGIRHACRRRATVRRRSVGARAFADVPAVVGARLGLVDLFPGSFADIVDEEARRGRVGIERDPERIPKAPGKGLLALVPSRRLAGHVAASRAGALEGVRRRDAAGTGDPQDLPDQHVLVARGVVLSIATAAGVVTGPVTDADVEVAVLPEPE